MMAHLEACLAFKYVAVDTEGYKPNPLGISIAHPLGGMYFPLNHKEDVNIDQEIAELLDHVLTTVNYRIFHHAGHDLTILPVLADLPFVCTMIMAHMIDENMFSKSLEFVSRHYTGKEGKVKDPLMEQIKKTLGWEYIPFELMNEYATEDAVLTMESFLAMLPIYEEQFGPLWSPDVSDSKLAISN